MLSCAASRVQTLRADGSLGALPVTNSPAGQPVRDRPCIARMSSTHLSISGHLYQHYRQNQSTRLSEKAQ